MKLEFEAIFNRWVLQQKKFVFFIDFEKQKPLIFSPEEAFAKGIWFQIDKVKNYAYPAKYPQSITLQTFPVSKIRYRKAFDEVQKHLHAGNTYLLNLTFATPVQVSNGLAEIFYLAQAPYKVFFKDQFVFFSPETFVKIIGNEITTYPMKGTIDAGIANAHEKLLQNKKELYEHNTIVDLLRNDLASVARKVRVNRFRYIDKITTSQGALLQVSSEISGSLPDDWKQNNPVEIFEKLLPAGSVSGAPKPKTLEIIRSVEKAERGYYTGIFGYFDGQNFDTAVMIRYIEKRNEKFYYRSGGGVTALSSCQDEYYELKQKIYVPVD